MSEIVTPKKVIPLDISIKAAVLYQCGTTADEYPGEFIEMNLVQADFVDHEDFVTVMRILTDAAKKKYNVKCS